MIRCETCGASNPDGASWCGQCLTSLTAPRASAPTVPAPAPGQPAAAMPTAPTPAPTPDSTPGTPAASSAPPAAAAPSTEVTTRGFRRREDGEMEWGCTGCGEFNPLGIDVCTVCGTPFAARWSKPAEPPPPPEAFTNALLASVLLPGAGHFLLKRTGSAVVRLLLFASWVIGAIVLISAGGPALVTAAPLILGVLAVWGLTVGDVLRLRSGQPELLRGRMVVWLVAGVIGLEILALLASSMTLA